MAGTDRSRQPEEAMRLDKWLWVARFFKTRQQASEAVSGGKVHVNGQRAKPGKDIAVGCRITITRDQCEWDIHITGLGKQRRSASEAQALYEESPESQLAREQQLERLRLDRQSSPQSESRPNKRERRLIHRFKRTDE